MSNSKFIYVTYIKTTPEKLWDALTKPEFTKQYWVDSWQECDWKKGSEWKLVIPGGKVADSGKILEIDKPRKLVFSWKHMLKDDMKGIDEKPGKCIYELEQKDDVVKLTITHESDVPDSRLIKAVSNGWPMILSSLKSLLENGAPLSSSKMCANKEAKAS